MASTYEHATQRCTAGDPFDMVPLVNCWFAIVMASYMPCRKSVRETQKTFVYAQAVGQVKFTISETNQAPLYDDLVAIFDIQKSRQLPPVVLLDLGMRVRLTTTTLVFSALYQDSYQDSCRELQRMQETSRAFSCPKRST